MGVDGYATSEIAGKILITKFPKFLEETKKEKEERGKKEKVEEKEEEKRILRNKKRKIFVLLSSSSAYLNLSLRLSAHLSALFISRTRSEET